MEPADKAIVWHSETLPQATRKAFQYLSEHGQWLKRSDWFLAGGTALALYEAHRASVDLDFFTSRKIFSNTGLLDHFNKKIWHTDILKEKTIYGKLFGAKVSFIACPYFKPSSKRNWYGVVPVLIPHDIAVMKIIAISQRGRKRDFIDLFWYCRKYESLDVLIASLKTQYPTVAHEYYHILKSLTYFDDAEADPMPKVFFKTNWRDIKKYFQREVPEVARKLLKLD